MNDQDGAPAPEHRDFYDGRRESKESAAPQGGETSDLQAAESDSLQGQATGEYDPVSRVTARDGGAKRDSFFRKRDYE